MSTHYQRILNKQFKYSNMRKIFTLITIVLIFTFKLEAKKIEGKIILEDDTIDVTFNIPINFLTQKPNYLQLQNKVKYFDSNGNKIILRPEDAKEINFNYANEDVRMLSRFNSLSFGNIFSMNKTIFLKLEIDGKLKLFTYYYSEKPGNFSSPSSMPGGVSGGLSLGISIGSIQDKCSILQKEYGELKSPKLWTFKKDMAKYFSDCPAIVEKLDNPYIDSNSLELLVNYYNSNCR